jgi:hypothetical protein
VGPSALWLILFAAAPAPPGQELTVDVGAKVETQVGTSLAGVAPAGTVSGNLQLEPGILIQERSATGVLTLSYIPWLLASTTTSKVLVLNRFRAEADNQLSHTAGIRLGGVVWVGDQNFSPVLNLGVPSGTGPPPTGPTIPSQLPSVNVLQVLDTSGRLGFYVQTSRTLRLDVDGAFVWTQGANAVSRLQLPIQRGPVLEVRATLGLGPSDTLIPTLRSALLVFGPIFRAAGGTNESGSTVTQTHFQTELDLLGTEVGARWQHRFSPDLSTELVGGVGLVRQGPSYDVLTVSSTDLTPQPVRLPVPSSYRVYPLAGVTLRDHLAPGGQPLDIALTAGITPIVDRFAASVFERFGASATVRWGFVARWRLEASAAIGLVTNPLELSYQGEARVVWQPGTHWQFAAGARTAFVNYNTPTSLNGLSWVVFLSASGATGRLL